MTICAKMAPALYYLPQVDKEYLVRKANEQAIKQKIVTLYDQVFIQQPILEFGLGFGFFGTLYIYLRSRHALCTCGLPVPSMGVAIVKQIALK